MYFGPTDHTVKISLREVKPKVWRRIRLSSDTLLPDVERIFQIAMGWEGYHLSEFRVGEICFGGNEDAEWVIDHADITLGQIVPKKGGKLMFSYDYGDGWEHDVLVESVEPAVEGSKAPTCLAGKHACPPEDCGGPGGYVNLLEAIADPQHEDHEQMVEWIGGTFDPTKFDRAAVNEPLRFLGPRPRR